MYIHCTKLHFQHVKKSCTSILNSKQQKPCEQENYPTSPEIIYYGNRKFTYVIVQEGIYPSATQLKYTEAPNYFPVPDNYIIETTWGRSSNS